MRTELNIARNFKEEEEAYQMALAGIEHARAEILSVKGPLYTYLNEEGVLILGQEDRELVRSGKLGKGSFSYTLIDEDGKLNINTASISQLRYIFQKTGVNDIALLDTIVDSIMDWRDRNDLHMLNGAEEDYYRSLQEPYSAKDGPFDTLEELLLVKGMTPEIFYGSKDEDQEFSGVVKYLTVRGSGKININTAPEIVLEAVMGKETADRIIRQREAGPILNPVAGGKVVSTTFTVLSTGTSADGSIKRTIKAILQRKGGTLKVYYWNDNFSG
jgi:general secretion pathway protein K